MTKVRTTYTGPTLGERVLQRIKTREQQQCMKNGTLSANWHAVDHRRRQWDAKLWSCSYAHEPDRGAERSIERCRTSGR